MRRDVLIVTCAVSAGIHAALVPEHLRESAGAGGGFIASVVLLAVAVFALTYRPSGVVFGATALVLAGLLVSYVMAVTTGVPLLHPEAESVDGLALFTKAVELLGLAAALDLIRTSRPAQLPFPLTRTEGVRT